MLNNFFPKIVHFLILLLLLLVVVVVVVVVVLVLVLVLVLVFSPWASLGRTRAQSGDRYGSGTLHPGQVLGVVCHCFPPDTLWKNMVQLIIRTMRRVRIACWMTKAGI
jgi:fatty acid desaturase